MANYRREVKLERHVQHRGNIAVKADCHGGRLALSVSALLCMSRRLLDGCLTVFALYSHEVPQLGDAVEHPK